MVDHAHILLIEDDAAVAGSLRSGLEREGFDVSWRDSGRAGLTLLEQANIQLVILDVRLPDGSGFDFCREMRLRQLAQPVLMLTVRDSELDRVLGLEMGADAYMTKPFSLRELLATVRALLRRAYGTLQTGSSPLLHVADLTIDLDASEVRRGAQALNLTPTEFRLLVYLARHKGQALSRAQLLDGVWGSSDIESERTVNVHVRRLRAKVEVQPSRPTLILTVPGVGYRLVDS